MFEMISEIHRILNYCKDFIAGYHSSVSDKMIVSYKGKLYKVTFEKLDKISDSPLEDMSVYLRNLNK